MGFFRDLITDGSGLSSKRFISVIGMFAFLIVIIISACGINVPDVIVLSLVTLIIGNGALTLANKGKNDQQ
jgi:hypothetical protein